VDAHALHSGMLPARVQVCLEQCDAVSLGVALLDCRRKRSRLRL
jgi:hypothetical protein